MSKIYTFIVIVPLIFMIMIRGIAFYEFDTKQRYIDNLVESISYKAKITGVVTNGELADLIDSLNRASGVGGGSVILQKNTYVSGINSGFTSYAPGEILNKGDGFLIYAESQELVRLSKIFGLGDAERMRYRAKSYVMVERYGTD